MKKLLLIGTGHVHTFNFARLVEPCFDQIEIIADRVDPAQPYRIHAVDFSLRKISNHVANLSRIRSIIRSSQPSIIHIQQANSVAYFALRAAASTGVPTVLTAWGSDVLLLPHQGFLLNRMVRYNLKSATALTADAKYVAAAMANLSGRNVGEILVANFGIEPLQVPVGKENIIYSNRLHHPLYCIDRIVNAFNHFHQTGQGSTWKLILAGSGPGTDSLKDQVREAGLEDAVEFAGWVDARRNAELYARSKFYASIPESDGTSISLLEAMAYGCIPVVSDLPANREWITDGRNGCIVGAEEEGFFSRALLLDAAKVARINKEEVERRATKAANRALFCGLYEQLLSQRTGSPVEPVKGHGNE